MDYPATIWIFSHLLLSVLFCCCCCCWYLILSISLFNWPASILQQGNSYAHTLTPPPSYHLAILVAFNCDSIGFFYWPNLASKNLDQISECTYRNDNKFKLWKASKIIEILYTKNISLVVFCCCFRSSSNPEQHFDSCRR